MASASDLWSLSGPTSGNTTSSGTRSGQTTGSGSATTSGSSSQSQTGYSFGQNTPDFALQTLQDLIAQFFPSNKISDEELNRVAPLPDRNSSQYTTYRTDANGNRYPVYVNEALYNTDLAAAQARRQDVIRQAGINPGKLSQGARDVKQLSSDIKGQRSGYTKEAAFADAGNLSARYMRQLLETQMPQINRAVEGSGTSGGAVAGLLAQDAAARTAESQAALGLQTAVQYGQISTGLDQLLAQLASVGNPELNQLIQLLGVAKGSIDQRITGGSSSGFEDKTTSQNTTQNETTKQTGTVTPNVTLPALSGSGFSGATPTPATGVQVANATPTDIQKLLKSLDYNNVAGNSRVEAFRF